MSLADLIRGKSVHSNAATATVATVATETADNPRAVASVAAVAVATARKRVVRPSSRHTSQLIADDASVGCNRSQAGCVDREPPEIAVSENEVCAEIPKQHAEETTAKLKYTGIESSFFSDAEDVTIRAWLAHIDESDPATIADVIAQCQRDPDAREYFRKQLVVELPMWDTLPDDRRTCDQCTNLILNRCQAAKRGEIIASPTYEPPRTVRRRCEGYAPGASDPDRRHGRERWPGLVQAGGK